MIGSGDINQLIYDLETKNVHINQLELELASAIDMLHRDKGVFTDQFFQHSNGSGNTTNTQTSSQQQPILYQKHDNDSSTTNDANSNTINKLRAENEKLLSLYRHSEGKLQYRNAQVIEFEKEREIHRNQCFQYNEKVSQLEKQKRGLIYELEVSTSQLLDYKNQYDHMQVMYENLQVSSSAQAKDYSMHDDIKLTLGAQLAASKITIANLEQIVKDMSSTLENEKAELNNRIVYLEDRLLSLDNRCRDYVSKCSQYEKDIYKLKLQVEQLSLDLKQCNDAKIFTEEYVELQTSKIAELQLQIPAPKRMPLQPHLPSAVAATASNRLGFQSNKIARPNKVKEDIDSPPRQPTKSQCNSSTVNNTSNRYKDMNRQFNHLSPSPTTADDVELNNSDVTTARGDDADSDTSTVVVGDDDDVIISAGKGAYDVMDINKEAQAAIADLTTCKKNSLTSSCFEPPAIPIIATASVTTAGVTIPPSAIAGTAGIISAKSGSNSSNKSKKTTNNGVKKDATTSAVSITAKKSVRKTVASAIAKR